MNKNPKNLEIALNSKILSWQDHDFDKLQDLNNARVKV
jgi:hypothetical protein